MEIKDFPVRTISSRDQLAQPLRVLKNAQTYPSTGPNSLELSADRCLSIAISMPTLILCKLLIINNIFSYLQSV